MEKINPDYVLVNGRLFSWEDFKGKTVSESDRIEYLYTRKKVVSFCKRVRYNHNRMIILPL